MNRCLSLLAAATLTLTAACGDNLSEPVEVDDDITLGFDRVTVDVEAGKYSFEYLVPDSIFSFVDQTRVDYQAVVEGSWIADRADISFNYELADLGTGAACNSFAPAPAGPQNNQIEPSQSIDQVAPATNPNELAPREIGQSNPFDAELGNTEMSDDRMACRDEADNGQTDIAGVCECADLDCVAGYVDAVMGCDVCMTFVCGDDILGACASCTP